MHASLLSKIVMTQCCSNFVSPYITYDFFKFTIPLVERIYGSQCTNPESMITFLSRIEYKKVTDTRSPGKLTCSL